MSPPTTDTARRLPGEPDGPVAVPSGGPLADRLAQGLAGLGIGVRRTVEGAEAPTAVVVAPWDPDRVRPVAVHELTDEQFDEAWQRTLDDAVATAIAARAAFADHGGRLVFVVPTVALAGGDHHAHWAAAAEGVHLLAKSAARQWGPEGVTANVLAVGPRDVLADPDAAGPVSIATPALPDADPAEVLAFLCSPGAANIGGQTLVVDGGLWM